LHRLPGSLLLGHRAVRRLSQRGTSRRIGTGDRLSDLVRGGGHRAVLVLEGRAAVVADGVVVGTIGPGEVVGAVAVLAARARHVHIVASTPMYVFAMDASGLDQLLSHAPLADLVAMQVAAMAARLAA
jgi:CRP-like cAMP-binding protein